MDCFNILPTGRVAQGFVGDDINGLIPYAGQNIVYTISLGSDKNSWAAYNYYPSPSDIFPSCTKLSQAVATTDTTVSERVIYDRDFKKVRIGSTYLLQGSGNSYTAHTLSFTVKAKKGDPYSDESDADGYVTDSTVCTGRIILSTPTDMSFRIKYEMKYARPIDTGIYSYGSKYVLVTTSVSITIPSVAYTIMT